MISVSNFRTSLRLNNVKDTRNDFANKNIGKMISQGCNAFRCNVMPNKPGPAKALTSLSHVRTASESRDLNMDYFGFKQLRVTNSFQEYVFLQVLRRIFGLLLVEIR